MGSPLSERATLPIYMVTHNRRIQPTGRKLFSSRTHLISSQLTFNFVVYISQAVYSLCTGQEQDDFGVIYFSQSTHNYDNNSQHIVSHLTVWQSQFSSLIRCQHRRSWSCPDQGTEAGCRGYFHHEYREHYQYWCWKGIILVSLTKATSFLSEYLTLPNLT